MQSTGQASTQAVSFVPMQGSAMTYAIGHPPYLSTLRPKPEQVQAGGTHSDFCYPLGSVCGTVGADFARLGRRSFRRGGSQILRGVLGCFWRENTKMKDYEGHGMK